MYLKASEDIQLLDEYNGEKGQFVKTFALSDKRNKNGWRVTWDSIKNNISDFSKNERPGIEYVKCENSICDLDHTDAATFETSLQVQEDFRKTTIIDYTLDENNHIAYAIHKVNDPEFYTKLENHEIRFVSPSIWPISGQYTVLGQMPNGLPKLDVYDWKAVHIAFVNNPAFGDEAKVTAMCEGEGCQMRLLTAADKKKLTADELAPLEEIPLLVKHKDHMTFVSTTKEISQKINDLFSKEYNPNIQSVTAILKNNSYSMCSCSSKLAMDAKELELKLDDATKSLKASTDTNVEKDKKIKDLESKLAKLEAKEACSKCGSMDHTTSEHTSENAKKGKKGETEPEEDVKAKNAVLEARIKSTELELAKPLISKMVDGRKSQGATDEQIKTFETALKSKTYEDIKTQFESEEILLNAITVKTESPEGTHFEFNGGNEKSLSGKSLETILEEAV